MTYNYVTGGRYYSYGVSNCPDGTSRYSTYSYTTYVGSTASYYSANTCCNPAAGNIGFAMLIMIPILVLVGVIATIVKQCKKRSALKY